jgi:hypothetical protein
MSGFGRPSGNTARLDNVDLVDTRGTSTFGTAGRQHAVEL